MAISNYNPQNVSSFDVNFDRLIWKKLEDMLFDDGKGTVYTLTGIFIKRNGKFGPRPYVSTDQYLVDLPQRRLDDVEKMLEDPEVIQQIKDGKAGFWIRSYMSKKYDKECFDVFFEDL